MDILKSSVILGFFIFLFFLFNAHKCLAFFDIEKKLIYYPMNKHIADVRLNLTRPLQDINFYSLDGTKLNAWYIESKNNKPTIVYCHGQGENISMWQSIAQFLSDNGYGIFMLEYRGHGRSKGSPRESGLYLDLESSIKYLKDYEKVEQHNIVLWGRSLGGAIVCDVASRDDFMGVILESTFTNIREEALFITKNKILESKYRFWAKISSKFVEAIPLTQKFDNENKVSMISSPLLIAHSLNDKTVPSYMSIELAERNPKAKLYLCKKGSHHSSEWIKDEVLSFLINLEPAIAKKEALTK